VNEMANPLGEGGYVSKVSKIRLNRSLAYTFSFRINGKVGRRSATSQAKAEELRKVAKGGEIPAYQRRRLSEKEKVDIAGKYQSLDQKGDWIYSCAPLAQMYGVSRGVIEDVLRERGIARRTHAEANRVRANRPEDKQRTTEQLRALHKDPKLKKRRIAALKKTLEAPEQRARLTNQSHKWCAYQAAVLKAAKPKKRGRVPGISGELNSRVELAAAFYKQGWTQGKMSGFIYPDAAASAYPNTRNLFARHRPEIIQKADNLSAAQAAELVSRVGAIAPVPALKALPH
jgi:hypothetical protein